MDKKTRSSGYSGTPLAKKLGIKTGSKIKLVNAPDYYFELFNDFPEVVVLNDTKTKKDFIHYFTTEAKVLQKDLPKLRAEIEVNGCIWVSWPKKSFNTITDVNENMVRETALKNKLVDVKVCAVDEKWSGLKLVIRLKDR